MLAAFTYRIEEAIREFKNRGVYSLDTSGIPGINELDDQLDAGPCRGEVETSRGDGPILEHLLPLVQCWTGNDNDINLRTQD